MKTTRSISSIHRVRMSTASAFSLIEVMTVFAIILFLMAILLPGYGRAREQVRRMICTNNLHHWGTAFQYYRDEHSDYLPTEGHHGNEGFKKPGTWYNELPPYLGLPPYRDLDGANEAIRDLPNIHVWICPSKNLTDSFKSDTGQNQFHYGMNQVLDGLGKYEPSRDTPGFKDTGEDPLRAAYFKKRPDTVLLFDIAPNSMAGTPRQVATKYWRFLGRGRRLARFHGDYANLLRIDGSVTHCTAADLLTDPESWKGEIIWNRPGLYWGYPLR